MSFWVLLQVLADLIFIATTAYLWIRLHRPAKDDPRLSRGLQLLQSKISVLEDLSDRTETQVSQVTALIEQKIKELQSHITASEKQIQAIDISRSRSMEVAKIFQDKIPHQEIIDRQNTIKYVKAARLAHQGASPEEIARQVDLSFAEIEFIAKVNRQQLQFSEEDLPNWVREEVGSAPTPAVSVPPPALTESRAPTALSELGQKFRSALEFQPATESQSPTAASATAPAGASHSSVEPQVKIRKVEFPRI